MHKSFLPSILLSVLHATAQLLYAETYIIQPNSDLVGEIQQHTVNRKDTWESIAFEYNIGYLELRNANQHVKSLRWHRGKPLVIPSQFILPQKEFRKGIVVNLAEKRLYFFPGNNIVMTYPVGVGRDGWETPTFKGRVISKDAAPRWVVPDSIRSAYLKKYGKPHDAIVEPGPDNPLGNYRIRLSEPRILIHGTHKNGTKDIGKNISSGCIRMYNNNLAELIHLIDIGTTVRFLADDEKLGVVGNDLYFEKNHNYPSDDLNSLQVKLSNYYVEGYQIFLDENLLATLNQSKSGIPTRIGSVSASSNYSTLAQGPLYLLADLKYNIDAT